MIPNIEKLSKFSSRGLLQMFALAPSKFPALLFRSSSRNLWDPLSVHETRVPHKNVPQPLLAGNGTDLFPRPELLKSLCCLCSQLAAVGRLISVRITWMLMETQVG